MFAHIKIMLDDSLKELLRMPTSDLCWPPEHVKENEKRHFSLSRDFCDDKEQSIEIKVLNDRLLIWPTNYRDVETVKLALEKDFDSSANEDYILRYAAMRGQLDVVQLVLENGANVRVLNDCALRWAAVCSRFEIIHLLLKHGSKLMPVFCDEELSFDDQMHLFHNMSCFDTISYQDLFLFACANNHAAIVSALLNELDEHGLSILQSKSNCGELQ